MKSEFPGNMYMYKICPKYQQSFKKVHAAVLEELLWQTVHYYILVWGQYFKYKRDKILRIVMESEFPGKCTSTLRVLNIDKVAAWGIIIPLINSAMK